MNKIIAVLTGTALGVAFAAAGSLFTGWMFMLVVGIVHAEWVPSLPTVGYWWAVLIAFLLNLVFASRTPSTPSRHAV